jgi:hypothetical protein
MPGESSHIRLTERDDAEIVQYRPVSAAAVGGLLLALTTPLAVLLPGWWGMLPPALAIVVNAVAWWRIARGAGAMVGGTLSLLGLLLSLAAAGAVPADRLTYRWLVDREAQRFASCWFAQLAEGQPQRAFQLTLTPGQRQPWDENLLDFYRNTPRAHRDLEGYVAQPLIRTLLALGDKAQVRHYQTLRIEHGEYSEVVNMIYAVSYDDAGQKKTFFVGLRLSRLKEEAGSVVEWMMQGAIGGVRPEGF